MSSTSALRRASAFETERRDLAERGGNGIRSAPCVGDPPRRTPVEEDYLITNSVTGSYHQRRTVFALLR